MRYVGGKVRIARHIVAAILKDSPGRRVYFEPFVGGANVFVQAVPHFPVALGADSHPDLIRMWTEVVSGAFIPCRVSREEYAALRTAPVSALRGFAGFGISFGGKWFGGYMTHDPRRSQSLPPDEAISVITKQANVLRQHGARFIEAQFGEITPPAGSVVYCDPPYPGTTGYKGTSLDWDYFTSTIATWAEHSAVYVSGYEPPRLPVRVVWSGERRRPLGVDSNAHIVTENLYRIVAERR